MPSAPFQIIFTSGWWLWENDLPWSLSRATFGTVISPKNPIFSNVDLGATCAGWIDFGPNGRIWGVIFLIALGFLAASLFRTLNVPWVEEDNYYGAIYAQAAHNNLRAGLAVTKGVPVTLYFGPLPIPRKEFYVHHPTLLPLMVTASVACFGESESAVKLVPIACSLLSAIFLWLLLRDTLGRRAAALVVVFFVTLPMELHYGDMVDFEPCLVMWMLAALLCLHRWETQPRIGWAVAAGACCFCALWTDWPAYLFVGGISLSYLLSRVKKKRLFGIALIGLAMVTSLLFLLQIHHANPNAWEDLWTAVTMRLGNGVATGSSGAAHEGTFTFLQWGQRILHALGENYLVSSWGFVLAGIVYLGCRMKSSPESRWIGWATLQMAIAGIPYMILLRNWSYIHDFASFFAMGALSILGGLGIEWLLDWISRRSPRFRQPAFLVALPCLFVWLATNGFIRAENQRSQFCILDGASPEPANLTPNLGRLMAQSFTPETAILCNFDPYGSTLPYYAERTVINNLSSPEEWNAQARAKKGAVAGVIWLASPSAAKIVESLPKQEISKVTVDGISFVLWKPENKVVDKGTGQ